jgi:hypothetical protein
MEDDLSKIPLSWIRVPSGLIMRVSFLLAGKLVNGLRRVSATKYLHYGGVALMPRDLFP